MGGVLGAVLTGGQSSRMGRDKTAVPVGESTMLERVAAALQTAVERVVLLGPPRAGWVCWPDDVDAPGPLAGIASVLHRLEVGRALVVAVDQPFVRGKTLQALISITSAVPVVPVDEAGIRQVTCAVYPASIADEARDEAMTGGSVQSLLDRVSFYAVTPDVWRGWGEDGRSWYSVDSPDDLEAGLRRFAPL